MLTPQDVKLITDVVKDQIELSETRTDKKLADMEKRLEKNIQQGVIDAINTLIIPAMDQTEEEVTTRLDDHEKRIKRLAASKIN